MEIEKISVLMCVFNSGKFLRSSIESVQKQTFHNVELIIIDDYSTDDSWEIASSYAEIDHRIQAIRSPTNLGAGAALNRGLQFADGDYVTRQDSDDVAFPERLVEQVTFLKENPEVGAVGTNVVYLDHHGAEYALSSFPLTNHEIQAALPDYMCFCGPTLLVRKKVLEKAGFYFAEQYSSAEDYDLCLRLAEVTQMSNIERPLYGYRQHPGSVSAAKRLTQLYYKVRSLEQATYRRYGTHPPQSYIEYIARDYLRVAILGWFSNDNVRSKKCLELARRYKPDLFHSGELKPSLEEIIKAYLPKPSIEASLAQVESLFRELLPRDKHLARLKSKMIAEIYISEAFDRVQKSPTHTIELGLIYKGVRHDPRWLSNRGIISNLIKGSIPNVRSNNQYK